MSLAVRSARSRFDTLLSRPNLRWPPPVTRSSPDLSKCAIRERTCAPPAERSEAKAPPTSAAGRVRGRRPRLSKTPSRDDIKNVGRGAGVGHPSRTPLIGHGKGSAVDWSH